MIEHIGLGVVSRSVFCAQFAGWLYVAAVVDLFSRRVVGWSMNAAMTAQLVTPSAIHT